MLMSPLGFCPPMGGTSREAGTLTSSRLRLGPGRGMLIYGAGHANEPTPLLSTNGPPPPLVSYKFSPPPEFGEGYGNIGKGYVNIEMVYANNPAWPELGAGYANEMGGACRSIGSAC